MSNSLQPRLKLEEYKTILEKNHVIADPVILQLSKVPLQAKQLLPGYSGIYYVLDVSTLCQWICN